jgi:hypothetical protein
MGEIINYYLYMVGQFGIRLESGTEAAHPVTQM